MKHLFLTNLFSRITCRTRRCVVLLVFLFVLIPLFPAAAQDPAGTVEKSGGSIPDAGGSTDNGTFIRFSHDSGAYPDDPLNVTLTAPDGYTIAFTLDGTIPASDDDSGSSVLDLLLNPEEPGYLLRHKDLMLYPEFIRIHIFSNNDLPMGIVLRAALVDPAGVVSDPETKVYFPGIDFTELYPGLIVISAAVDPDDLLDYERGILAAGSVYDEWLKIEKDPEVFLYGYGWEFESNSTQRGRAWERPCILQIYDGRNTISAELNAGMRITGGYSRRISQKSFNFYFRKEYGKNRLDYELFEGTEQYKSFSMKAGGNNAEWLKFKEAFLQELAADRKVCTERSRPAVLFLNGEYWGPYMLTEKISDQMISDRFGVDKDQVVVFKEGELEEGKDEDVRLYNDLMAFADKDLSDPELYRQFCGIMDVQSMADYCALQIYIGNVDWAPDSNDMLWRTRDTSYNNGRWQYILHDIEFSTGQYGFKPASAEADNFHLAFDNYPLFKAAMKNPDFARLFTDALQEIGSANYAPERVNSEVRKYLDIWSPLMPDYYKRFGDYADNWDLGYKHMVRFFGKRYPIIMQYVQNQ